jgi:hypothetical protein
LNGEAIPLSEVVELAIVDGHLHGIVLCEVRRLDFVLILQGAFLVHLVVIEACAELLVEEVNIA